MNRIALMILLTGNCSLSALAGKPTPLTACFDRELNSIYRTSLQVNGRIKGKVCAVFEKTAKPDYEEKTTEYFELSQLQFFPAPGSQQPAYLEGDLMYKGEVSAYHLCNLFGKKFLPGYDNYGPNRTLWFFGKTIFTKLVPTADGFEKQLIKLKCVAFGQQ